MRARIFVEGAATRLEGPLLFLRRTLDVGLNEAVEIEGGQGPPRLGRVAALDEEVITLEVLESTSGLGLAEVRVRFHGRPLHFELGPGLLGRVFDGVGRVIDGGPPLAAAQSLRIDGLPISPMARATPRDFIETGVTAVDLMNSLVRGQKLPLFSGGGLPHDRIAVEIACHARLRRAHEQDFAIVFAGIGVPYESADYFRRSLEASGALERTALFLNLASDSSTQRLLTPRFALTAAEYLAFEQGKQVLVILTDMTNYCEALREVSSSLGEIPGRMGYPGYMYSALAALYERAGCIQGRPGTLTQLSILTMPADDIGHPVPDLTGYITEGQIVLSPDLHRKGIAPPIDVLPCLSRLMNAGIGAGKTRADHRQVADQLYALYATSCDVRRLMAIVGETALSEEDRRSLAFARRFEQEFIHQGQSNRPIEATLAQAWELLGMLPRRELKRLTPEFVAQYYPQTEREAE